MIDINYQVKFYDMDSNVVFRKTKERFGGLSNMCSGYPITIGDFVFLTSESLYQCCRFNNDADIQKIIINEKSPISSKMKSKKYRSRTRDDWYSVRVDIMDWCIRMKLKSNWKKFSELLLCTVDKQIVEESHKDQFWGCVKNKDQMLEGANVLGQLLTNLRDEIKMGIVKEEYVSMKRVNNMRFFDKSIYDLLGVQ